MCIRRVLLSGRGRLVIHRGLRSRLRVALVGHWGIEWLRGGQRVQRVGSKGKLLRAVGLGFILRLLPKSASTGRLGVAGFREGRIACLSRQEWLRCG